jgi:hypothetical protein
MKRYLLLFTALFAALWVDAQTPLENHQKLAATAKIWGFL